MKILHSGTLDINAGGPAMSVYNTLNGLRKIGVDTEIIMYPLSANGKLRGDDIKVHYAKAPIDNKFLFSTSLKKEIFQLGIYDIYHAQGIWQYPTYAIIDIAKRNRKPYIITPRGVLYPQDIAKASTFIKKLSLKWRLLEDLNNAACVHVTCKDEMRYCRELGVKSPIAIIPNPVEIKDYPANKSDDIFRVGYLGRLSPRKNVESLIYTFNNDLLKDNAELIIIGGGDDKYENFLKEEVKRLNINNVIFKGFRSGDEKESALSSCSILAMPSEFENLGKVILEGLVSGIPCIATKGSPWEDLTTYDCGWWVDYNQESISNAVINALNCTPERLRYMGLNGKDLMANNYSVESVSNKMEMLYKWVSEKTNKPDFIYD